MSDPLRAHAPDPELESGLSSAETRARDRERAEAEAAVAEVMQGEEKKAARRAVMEAARAPRPRNWQAAALALLLSFNLYIWFGHPAWLEYHTPTLPSVDYYEGSWKIAVWLQRQRIEEYRRTHDAVPATARQAGPPVRGVDYAPLEQKKYLLTAGQGRRMVVYHSTDSIRVFLGRSLVTMGLITGGVR